MRRERTREKAVQRAMAHGQSSGAWQLVEFRAFSDFPEVQTLAHDGLFEIHFFM